MSNRRFISFFADLTARPSLNLLDESLDLADKEGKVGSVKTVSRCGNAIILDVRLDMFVVGIRAL